MNEKKETLYFYLKKARNKTSKTIIQSLLFQSAVWFLNILYTVYTIHFCDNNKFSGKQSRFRFRTGDSCVNQLPSIIHGNFTSFDNGNFGNTFVSDLHKRLTKRFIVSLETFYKRYFFIFYRT